MHASGDDRDTGNRHERHTLARPKDLAETEAVRGAARVRLLFLLHRIRLGSRCLRSAARRRYEIGFRRIRRRLTCTPTALIAHAAHDRIEIGRAGAGLQRLIENRCIDLRLGGVLLLLDGEIGLLFGRRNCSGFLAGRKSPRQSAQHGALLGGGSPVLGVTVQSRDGGSSRCFGGRTLRIVLLRRIERIELSRIEIVKEFFLVVRFDRRCGLDGELDCRPVFLVAGRAASGFQQAQPVDDLQKRVVDRLECPGIAVIGPARQFLQSLHLFRKFGRVTERCPLQGLDRFLRRLARGIEDRITVVHDGAFDFGKAWTKIIQFRQSGARLGEMRRKIGDLCFELADEFGIQARKGRVLKTAGDVFQPLLEHAERLVVCALRLGVQPGRQFGEANVDGGKQVWVSLFRGTAVADLFGDRIDALLQITEERLFLIQGSTPLLLHEGSQRRETVFELAKQGFCIRRAIQAIQPVGDQHHLLRQLLDRLFRKLHALADMVDAVGQMIQAVGDPGRGPVLNQLLDRARQRRDAGFDPLEGLGIHAVGPFHRERCRDGARDLVEPLLDHTVEIGGMAVRITEQMVERGCKRTHLLFQGIESKGFGQSADRFADFLDTRAQRVYRRIPMGPDGAQGFFPRQSFHFRPHLFEFKPQDLDGAFVATSGKRLDRIGEALEFHAQFAAVRT